MDKIWSIKSTPKNCQLIFDIVLSQLQDESGRGEFDDDVGVMRTVERTIEWFLEDKNMLKQLDK